jgi:phospholipid transport system substrate-binding protein
MRRFVAISGLVLVGVLVQWMPGFAAQDPRAFVYNVGTQGLQVVGPSVPVAQRVAVFRQLFQGAFDVLGLAQFALGSYWRYLNSQQQQEFVYLFSEFTAQAYATALRQYAGGRLKVGGVGVSAAGEVIVRSKIKRDGSAPVRIEWYLVERDGQYKIVDILVEGVSQRLTERNEFAGIIQRNNGRPDAILAVLRQLIAQSEVGSTMTLRR